LYLFILESIGTSELILIGIIALIVFGPRKLPQMAKTIGKTMADFRRTTNEFKSTWEREADLFKEENIITTETITLSENSIKRERTISTEQIVIETPEIKEIGQERIDQLFSGVKGQKADDLQNEQIDTEKNITLNKRDWL